MHSAPIIQRALLSVYDKTNILPLAECLHLHGVELISTGNTAALLQSHGLPVTQVSDYTGSAEIMQGRVKTLHPKIHGGILGRRDIDSDIMIERNIPDIDVVVVNLYPFQSVIADPDCTLAEAIENIDIGGPAMIRGAAKNHEWCTVLTSPDDYAPFIEEFEKNNGTISTESRFHFATKAFAHTATYDSTIAQYLAQKEAHQGFGATLSLQYPLKEILRYGENPHQDAALYAHPGAARDSITNATLLQGKALSFNNIVDADTALECVKQFTQPACVIVKHANPSGVCVAATPLEAYLGAHQCDPVAAFGGIVAFNQPIDLPLMTHILATQFIEVLIAPAISNEAVALLAEKKPLCRLLQYHPATPALLPGIEIKSVGGGILVQTCDQEPASDYRTVTQIAPSAAQMADLLFSWKVAQYSKSNAIVFALAGQTRGIGAGQMSRIVSTQIAGMQAEKNQLSLQGAVMASDAFFPFPDNVEMAHALGIKAIIQPGGAKRDEEIIACANALGIAMVFTHIRHFRH